MKQLLIILLFAPYLLLSQEPTRTITVYGEAEAELTPDEIFLEVVYTEFEKSKNSELDGQVQKFKDLMKTYKIRSEDVQVVNLAGYSNSGFSSKKIHRNKSYSIKLTEATTASEIMTKLLETGAASVYISDLRYTQKDEIKKLVAQSALKNARDKAQMMAEVQGNELGSTIFIKEFPADDYEEDDFAAYNQYASYRNRINATGAVSRSAGSSYYGDPYTIEKVTIASKVRVVYELN